MLPFRNRIVIQTMTGAVIKEVLEQQFDNIAPGQDRILNVSRGFSYSYDRSAPQSRRVDAASIKIDGRPVLPNQRYRVAHQRVHRRRRRQFLVRSHAAAMSRRSPWISTCSPRISTDTRRSSRLGESHHPRQIAVRNSRLPQREDAAAAQSRCLSRKTGSAADTGRSTAGRAASADPGIAAHLSRAASGC